MWVACGSHRPPVRFPQMGDDSVLHDHAYDRVRLTRTDDKELRVITDVKLKAELRHRFPELTKQITRFEDLCQRLLVAFPIWCAIHVSPWRFQPAIMKALLPSVWWKYAGRTGEEVLNELFADAPESQKDNVLKLQGYLCGLWLYMGCPPHRVSFFMVAAVTLGFPHEGGAYPAKGTGEMAASLVECIEAHGGSCLVRAPVERILIDENGRAVGVETSADAGSVKLYANTCVISAAGWRNTARLCKGSAFPSEQELSLPQGDGFVMANIGIKGSAETLNLECANMELLPVGNGVSVFDGIRAYLDDPLGVPPMEIPMMFTFPSVKDRSYKRDGVEETARESAQILCLAKTEWFGEVPKPEVGNVSVPSWQHPVRLPEYQKIKQQWIDRLREVFFSIYPQLEDKIELFDLSTPLSIEHYLPTGSGSAIGLDVSGGIGCRFTCFKTMSMLDMRSAVPGLWMTGQDTLLIGVPLAQAAGLITAMRIAGPLRSAWFVLRSVWLVVAGVGYKARNKVVGT